MAGKPIRHALVAISAGDDILTCDPRDLHALSQAAGVHVELIAI